MNENPKRVLLSSNEIKYRGLVAQILADNVKNDPYWNRYLVSAMLFGSLARNEGHVGSDVDIGFLVRRVTPFSQGVYLEESARLRRTVDEYRDSLVIPFPVNPALIDKAWLRNPQAALVYPGVIAAINREGIKLF